MSTIRKIAQKYTPSLIIPGVLRCVGGLDIKGKGFNYPLAQIDPFILLDAATVKLPGKPDFGAHPHCGFSVTSLIISGRFKSWDSIKQEWEDDRVGGSVYWVNSGRGIMHAEESVEAGDNCLFQLWMNIPDSRRNDKPSVNFLPADGVPVVKLNDGIIIRVLVGTFQGVTSPMEPITPITILHVKQPPHVIAQIPVDPTFNGFIVNGNGVTAIDSSANYSGTKSNTIELLVLDNSGDFVEVATEEKAAEYLILSGKPIGEPWVKLLGYNGGLIAKDAEDAEKKMKEFEEKRLKFGQE